MSNLPTIPPKKTPQLNPEATEALLNNVRESLIQETFDPNDQELLQQMVESLGDSRGMIRLGFADTLGKVGQPALSLLLDALAHHPNVVVRRAAGKTLTLIADPTAVPHLIHALLHDPDTVVKGSVVGALARTGEASVFPLLEILANPDYPESTKGHASWALAFIGTEAKEILSQQINSDSADVRLAIVGALAKVAQDEPDEKTFQLLIDALEDHEAMVRCEAATALGNLSHLPALSHLISLLTHPDGETRKATALALMKIGDRTAIEPLKMAVTQENDPAIKKAIELALTQLEKRQTLS